MAHDMHGNDDRDGDAGKGRLRLVFFAFLAIAAYFLVTEHRAHLAGVLSYLPFLLLLACPLLHMFGHGGHGGHGDHRHGPSSDPGKTDTTAAEHKHG